MLYQLNNDVCRGATSLTLGSQSILAGRSLAADYRSWGFSSREKNFKNLCYLAEEGYSGLGTAIFPLEVALAFDRSKTKT